MTQWVRIGRQLVRYSAAGGIAFVADFATLVLAVQVVHLHYLVAATLGFVVGVIVCYALSLRWVFDEHTYRSRRFEFIAFASIGVLGLMLNDVVMWSLVESAHVSYPAGKVVAAALVLVFNFTARRSILFSKRTGNAVEMRRTPLRSVPNAPALR